MGQRTLGESAKTETKIESGAFMETHQRDAFLSWGTTQWKWQTSTRGSLGEECTHSPHGHSYSIAAFNCASVKGDDASSNACLVTGSRQFVSGAILEFPFPQMRERKTTEDSVS